MALLDAGFVFGGDCQRPARLPSQLQARPLVAISLRSRVGPAPLRPNETLVFRTLSGKSLPPSMPALIMTRASAVSSHTPGTGAKGPIVDLRLVVTSTPTAAQQHGPVAFEASHAKSELLKLRSGLKLQIVHQAFPQGTPRGSKPPGSQGSMGGPPLAPVVDVCIVDTGRGEVPPPNYEKLQLPDASAGGPFSRSAPSLLLCFRRAPLQCPPRPLLSPSAAEHVRAGGVLQQLLVDMPPPGRYMPAVQACVRAPAPAPLRISPAVPAFSAAPATPSPAAAAHSPAASEAGALGRTCSEYVFPRGARCRWVAAEHGVDQAGGAGSGEGSGAGGFVGGARYRPPPPRFTSFTITDEDGQRRYGYALIAYAEVAQGAAAAPSRPRGGSAAAAGAGDGAVARDGQRYRSQSHAEGPSSDVEARTAAEVLQLADPHAAVRSRRGSVLRALRELTWGRGRTQQGQDAAAGSGAAAAAEASHLEAMSHRPFMQAAVCVISAWPAEEAMRALLRCLYSCMVGPTGGGGGVGVSDVGTGRAACLPLSIPGPASEAEGQARLAAVAVMLRPLLALRPAVGPSVRCSLLLPDVPQWLRQAAGRPPAARGLPSGRAVTRIHLPDPRSLPPVSAGYVQLLKCLSPANVVKAVELLLLEQRVVVHCRHAPLLLPVTEALLALLFPLTWQAPFLPCCPASLLDILDCPTAFLIGLHTALLPIQLPAEVFLVDLDRDRVTRGYEGEPTVVAEVVVAADARSTAAAGAGADRPPGGSSGVWPAARASPPTATSRGPGVSAAPEQHPAPSGAPAAAALPPSAGHRRGATLSAQAGLSPHAIVPPHLRRHISSHDVTAAFRAREEELAHPLPTPPEAGGGGGEEARGRVLHTADLSSAGSDDETDAPQPGRGHASLFRGSLGKVYGDDSDADSMSLSASAAGAGRTHRPQGSSASSAGVSLADSAALAIAAATAGSRGATVVHEAVALPAPLYAFLTQRLTDIAAAAGFRPGMGAGSVYWSVYPAYADAGGEGFAAALLGGPAAGSSTGGQAPPLPQYGQPTAVAGISAPELQTSEAFEQGHSRLEGAVAANVRDAFLRAMCRLLRGYRSHAVWIPAAEVARGWRGSAGAAAESPLPRPKEVAAAAAAAVGAVGGGASASKASAAAGRAQGAVIERSSPAASVGSAVSADFFTPLADLDVTLNAGAGRMRAGSMASVATQHAALPPQQQRATQVAGAGRKQRRQRRHGRRLVVAVPRPRGSSESSEDGYTQQPGQEQEEEHAPVQASGEQAGQLPVGLAAAAAAGSVGPERVHRRTASLQEAPSQNPRLQALRGEAAAAAGTGPRIRARSVSYMTPRLPVAPLGRRFQEVAGPGDVAPQAEGAVAAAAVGVEEAKGSGAGGESTASLPADRAGAEQASASGVGLHPLRGPAAPTPSAYTLRQALGASITRPITPGHPQQQRGASAGLPPRFRAISFAADTQGAVPTRHTASSLARAASDASTPDQALPAATAAVAAPAAVVSRLPSGSSASGSAAGLAATPRQLLSPRLKQARIHLGLGSGVAWQHRGRGMTAGSEGLPWTSTSGSVAEIARSASVASHEEPPMPVPAGAAAAAQSDLVFIFDSARFVDCAEGDLQPFLVQLVQTQGFTRWVRGSRTLRRHDGSQRSILCVACSMPYPFPLPSPLPSLSSICSFLQVRSWEPTFMLPPPLESASAHAPSVSAVAEGRPYAGSTVSAFGKVDRSASLSGSAIAAAAVGAYTADGRFLALPRGSPTAQAVAAAAGSTRGVQAYGSPPPRLGASPVLVAQGLSPDTISEQLLFFDACADAIVMWRGATSGTSAGFGPGALHEDLMPPRTRHLSACAECAVSARSLPAFN